MGCQREQCDGRKFVDGTYMRAMQGSMDVVDYLVNNGRIDERKDLIVVRNECEINEMPQKLVGGWRNIKHQTLIPMKKRAQHQMYKK